MFFGIKEDYKPNMFFLFSLFFRMKNSFKKQETLIHLVLNQTVFDKIPAQQSMSTKIINL